VGQAEGDRLAGGEGVAEVEVDEVANVEVELLGEGAIEVEAADAGAEGCRGEWLLGGSAAVAWRQVDEYEREDDDGDQDSEGMDSSACEQRAHNVYCGCTAM
jgi:hypothetical protein